MILSAASDKLQILCTTAVPVDCHVAYMDHGHGGVTKTPGRMNAAVLSDSAVDILTMAGGAGNPREVTLLTARNKDASDPVTVTLQLEIGGVAYELYQTTLNAGDTLLYMPGVGFVISPAAAVVARAVEALTAETVLTAADSGKLLTLGDADGFDVALPAPSPGLNFTFVVKVAPTTAYTITTNGTTQNVIHGQVVSKDLDAASDGDATAGTAVDVITFVANKALVGDRVELVCDGTLWYAVAFAAAFDGITFD